MEPGKKKLTLNQFKKPFHETTYKKINKKKEVNKASIDIESKINKEFNAIKKENQEFLKAAIVSFSDALKKNFNEIIKSTVKELSTVIKNENKKLLDSIDKRFEKREKHLEDLIKANNENILKIIKNSKTSASNSNDAMRKILNYFNDEEIKILNKHNKRNSNNLSRLFSTQNSSYNTKKKENITSGKRIKNLSLPSFLKKI